mmetsp:Transcript_20145/g.35805  ORF Transcript_20145/g.35805 Transcript_20145/m.35805 type:complete len:254 (-) Transcript_20145:42-803(-)
MAEADLLQRATRLLQEQPKVGAAMKNLMAVQLGRIQANQMQSKVHVIGEDGVEVREDLDDLDVMVLQKLCALVLRTINSFDLASPSDWAEANPQGENQNGLDRMDQIAQYKVVHMVWSKAKSNDAKVTKQIGSSALRLCWPQLRPVIIDAIEQAGVGSAKIADALLNKFVNPCEEQDTDDKAREDDDLIWSADFQKALTERSQRRAKLALERSADTASPQPQAQDAGGDTSSPGTGILSGDDLAQYLRDSLAQ